ncbi:MAG: hypothetical protein OJF49_002503 [Ktedonobacterales bacterium]|jgi:transposase|nr:MAG: hypothetical protein OJF49_002503 [Ktedonobacterales bacterium]
MRQRRLALTAGQRRELVQMRDRDRRAYLRERAAALLKIAEGRSVRAVALRGLHRRRKPDTVYGWLNAYLTGGVAALVQRARGHRGFSPSAGARIAPGAAPSA